jgi:hypothetical protein
LTASGLIADSGRPQNSFKLVIPAKAGIQLLALPYEELDPGFRRDDGQISYTGSED